MSPPITGSAETEGVGLTSGSGLVPHALNSTRSNAIEIASESAFLKLAISVLLDEIICSKTQSSVN